MKKLLMKSPVMFIFIICTILYSSFAGAALSSEIFIRGKLVSYNNRHVILSQDGHKFKLPRSSVGKSSNLKIGQWTNAIVNVDLRTKIRKPSSINKTSKPKPK